MRRNLLLSVLFIFSSITAETRKVIAVTDIDHKGLTEIEENRIFLRIETELIELDKYDLTTRSELDKILEELKFQNSGCVKQECAAEIGRIAQANYMLLPNILYDRKTGEISANFRLVDPESAKIKSAVMGEYTVENISQFTKNIFPMLIELYKKESGKSNDVQILRKSEQTKYEVVFDFNIEGVLSRHGQFSPIEATGKKAVFKLNEGQYEFYFQKDQYKTLNKSFVLNEDKQFLIELEPDESKSKSSIFLPPGILMIDTEPKGCEIIIGGQKVGTSPLDLTLVPGTHKVELHKSLYYSEILEINIRSKEVEQLDRSLDPKFGTLDIKIINPNEFENMDKEHVLKINGKLYKSNELLKLNSGNHSISIEKQLYHTYNQTIEIIDGENHTLEVLLKPAFGLMKIDTYPENDAKVYIDNNYVGRTPFSYDQCPSGLYTIRVEKEYFNITSEEIEVSDGAEINRTLILTPNVGDLIINAPGADIYVNDEKVGNGEIIKKYKPGNYIVRAERDLHYPEQKEIFVAVNKPNKIDFELKPIMGSIAVVVTPSEVRDAIIYINGIDHGNAPKIITTNIGDYVVEIKNKDFLDQKKWVKVSENKNSDVKFNLMTYAGSLKQKKDKWKNRAKISFISFCLSTISAGYFTNQANSAYDSYGSATTSQNAIKYKNSTLNNEISSKIALSLSVISGTSALSSLIINQTLGWFGEGKNNNKKSNYVQINNNTPNRLGSIAPSAKYYDELKKNDLVPFTGNITMKIYVNSNGYIGDIVVKHTDHYLSRPDMYHNNYLNYEIAVKEAHRLVKSMKIQPAIKNGYPVDAWFEVPVSF